MAVHVPTHPFSSFSCWYSSNLLLMELARPANSWCFLELAAVMRLVHMVRRETGPVGGDGTSPAVSGTVGFYVTCEMPWWVSVPLALSGGGSSSLDARGFLLSGSGESGESLITSDS